MKRYRGPVMKRSVAYQRKEIDRAVYYDLKRMLLDHFPDITLRGYYELSDTERRQLQDLRNTTLYSIRHIITSR